MPLPGDGVPIQRSLLPRLHLLRWPMPVQTWAGPVRRLLREAREGQQPNLLQALSVAVRRWGRHSLLRGIHLHGPAHGGQCLLRAGVSSLHEGHCKLLLLRDVHDQRAMRAGSPRFDTGVTI